MYVKNRESESPEVKIRRFFRDVQQSGLLSEIKGRRYYSKKVSRTLRRKSAVRKALIKRVKRGY